MLDKIEEYESSGISIRFLPSEVERLWDEFKVEGTLTALQARAVVIGLLSRDFVEQTMSQLSLGFTSQEPYEVCNVQQGLKFAVYKVSASERKFILIISRGAEQLNRELISDFTNLRALRKGLMAKGFPVFVPEVYALGQHEGIPGFSVESLDHHVEMGVRPNGAIVKTDKLYTEFIMNGKTDPEKKAEKFNAEQERSFVKSKEAGQVEYFSRNLKIRTELIKRLFAIYRVENAVPAEFEVNAGDFMADPSKEDFDLRLITVRGGWEKIKDDNSFVEWLKAHVERVGMPPHQLNFSIFSAEEALIREAMGRSP